MKTLIGVNTLTDVAQEVYSSHCAFWARTIRQFPKDEFYFFSPKRMSIDRMRNEAARMALAMEADYLMFIDDDVIVQPHTFKSLMECNLDIVMAHTYIRGYPYKPMCFKYFAQIGTQKALSNYDKVVEDANENGISLCDAIGFSCALIKVDILKKLEPPFFVTIGGACTEDVYFCVKARKEIGPEVSIGVDTKVPTAHLVERTFVEEKIVQNLRDYHEAVNGKPEVEAPDREKEEIEKALEMFS